MMNINATNHLINQLTESAGEIRDNRFAVVNEVHFDLTSWCGCDDGLDYHVITVYKAEGCHNMSYASEDYLSDENVAHVEWSHDESEATERFVQLITQALA